MTICIYCGEEKAASELTLEHVIPKSIGGNIKPTNPFTINNVCKRCNNICGAYVDGPFIKSWLTQNNKAQIAQKYLNLTEDVILPLSYMGVIEDLNFESKICEYWLGPTGDSIYHFHEPYPEEKYVSPMIGRPSYARKSDSDNGFVFIYVVATNPTWHPAIFYSLKEQFSKSTLYLGNGPTPLGGAFSDIPKELSNLHALLESMKGETHKVSMAMGIHYGDRFLAKIALGMGSIFLHNDFIKSKSALKLRNFMWTKEPKEREKVLIKGSGFLNSELSDRQELLNCDAGHLFLLLPSKDNLVLYVNFYGKQVASIEITSEPKHWKGKVTDEGVIFLIAPGVQKSVGPISLIDFISHRSKVTLNADLLYLDDLILNRAPSPPYQI